MPPKPPPNPETSFVPQEIAALETALQAQSRQLDQIQSDVTHLEEQTATLEAVALDLQAQKSKQAVDAQLVLAAIPHLEQLMRQMDQKQEELTHLMQEIRQKEEDLLLLRREIQQNDKPLQQSPSQFGQVLLQKLNDLDPRVRNILVILSGLLLVLANDIRQAAVQDVVWPPLKAKLQQLLENLRPQSPPPSTP
ncbi:MAG: hypothetical protein HY326_11910, partial [Chloroflexi bacterium]|nr:hypothetical protein [Chloroflexota bacterium]